MKKFWTILFGILAFGVLTYSQRDDEGGEKYVIGIGNDNPSIYWEVLDYLERSPYVIVYARCPDFNLIGITVRSHTFMDYDEFIKYLKFEFEGLQVFKKDESLFTAECLKNGEISK